MLSEEARRLEQAWQMGFSCDIEGLARDPRLDTYTEELLWDRSLTPAQRDRLLFRKIKGLYPSQDVEFSKDARACLQRAALGRTAAAG